MVDSLFFSKVAQFLTTIIGSIYHDHLQIQTNIIHQSYLHKVKRLLFLGSSCIYPKHCSQPMKEEYLMTGLLEPTNSPYAMAKIAGIEMCHSYNRQYKTNYIGSFSYLQKIRRGC